MNSAQLVYNIDYETLLGFIKYTENKKENIQDEQNNQTENNEDNEIIKYTETEVYEIIGKIFKRFGFEVTFTCDIDTILSDGFVIKKYNKNITLSDKQ